MTTPRPAHRYGPHDPSSAPSSITVLQRGRRGQLPMPVVVPLPAALVRQRRQLNELAALDAWVADHE